MKVNSRERAPEAFPPLGSSGGDRGTLGPTYSNYGLNSTRTIIDLSADGGAILIERRNAESFIQGGSAAKTVANSIDDTLLRRPRLLTPTATMTATEMMRPAWRILT